MDPLGEALHFLRMSGTFYCRSELSAPWALALPAMTGCLSFHVVTSGRCWLEVERADHQRLEPGDLALVPHGEGHRLSSHPGTPAPRLDELQHEKVSDRYAILRHGGGGAATSLVCGAGAKEHHTRPAVDPLFSSAALAYGPRVVGVVLTGGGHDGMQGLLDVTTAGGLSLVQMPSEAENASMPEYAIARDHVRAALTVDKLGDALVLLARGGAVPIDASPLTSASGCSR